MKVSLSNGQLLSDWNIHAAPLKIARADGGANFFSRFSQGDFPFDYNSVMAFCFSSANRESGGIHNATNHG